MFEIVDCNPVRVVKAGVVVARVTANPADVACIAGELEREAFDCIKGDGEALLWRLVTDGECPMMEAGPILANGDGEELWLTTPAAGEAGVVVTMEGEWRMLTTDGEVRIPAAGDGEARTAGEPTRLGGRQCFTESEPDCESLLLLGDPGEDTITWRGLRPPAAACGPTRGESGR